MSVARDTPKDAVLVGWVSVNHAAAPFITALGDRKSPLRNRVSHLYLCWRDVAGPHGEDERAALKKTVEDLHATFDPVCPAIEKRAAKTIQFPTDHAAIRPFAEKVLHEVRKQHPGSHIYVNVSPGTPAMHAVWLVLGSTDFIEGPLTIIRTNDKRGQEAGQPPVQEVEFKLDLWLRHYQASRPRTPASDDDGQLWNPTQVKSRALRDMFEQLVRWAPLKAPVLLIGERGTGKTTLANFLRSTSPFQRLGKTDWPSVVCGQFRVNPQLARSELFGHKKGAFTGALTDRKGLLEEADGDSLFLDEIADIDHDTQRLLMAAVEGRGFHRLGDNLRRDSGFRLISATNRRLESLVGSDHPLDPDFFDRIAVFTAHVPPLRECREDLPDLWARILRRTAAQAGIADGWQPFAAEEQLITALHAHPLPGNFRDLQKMAFHLLAGIRAQDPPQTAIRHAIASVGRAAVEDPLPALAELRTRLPLAGGLDEHLRAYRQRWVDAALAAGDGTIEEAARLLGVNRRTLNDWIKKS